MRKLLALALGLLLLLSACGGADKGTASETTRHPVTTAKSATTRQIASIVAEQDRPLRDAYAKAHPCVFYDQPSCDLVAQLSLRTFGTIASTLRLDLDAADNNRPGNGLYVGAYPPELASLITETLAPLAAIEEAAKDYEGQGCPQSKAQACGQRAVEMLLVQGDSLISKLDAWRPYL